MAGTISFSSDAIQFDSDGTQIALPIARLHFQLDSKRRVTFTDPAQPGIAIYTHEDRILHHPALKKEQRLQTQRETIERTLQRRTFARLAGWLILTGLGLIAVFWWLATFLIGFMADRIPVAWEVEAGKLAFLQIQARGKLIDRSDWHSQLAAISKRLLTAIPDQRYSYQLHILDHPDPNAFALPGGIITFHSGFFQTATSPEEIAGVLAHEMAHVQLRHSLRQLLKSSAPKFLLSLFIGDQQGFLALAGRSTEILLRQRYSRDFEREADQTAWQYLLAANIDPRGLAMFLEKLAANPKMVRAEKTSFSWLNSHPATAERIEYLHSLWDQSSRKSGFEKIQLKNSGIHHEILAIHEK